MFGKKRATIELESGIQIAPVVLDIVPSIDWNEDALKLAKRNFGYSVEGPRGKSKKLMGVLADLEIGIFDYDTVVAYQRDMIRKEGGFSAKWETLTIAEYNAPIPVDALNLANVIHAALPKAKFYVEYFNRAPDPFLIVEHEGAQAYIAVWDEPDFNGKARIAGR